MVVRAGQGRQRSGVRAEPRRGARRRAPPPRPAELLDGRDVDTGLAAWLDATTGPLRDELRGSRAESARILKEQGTTTRAEVTDAAVTELDDRSGTARLIATVRIEARPRTGGPTTDRKRFEAGLARTGGGWKLTSLTAVAVGTG